MKAADGKTFEFGPFRVDVSNWQLLRDGRPIALEPQVFKLLLVLLEQRGGLLEKTELMARLWPDTHVEDRTLTQHVYVLRKALEPHGDRYVQNVRKRGYRFVGDVTVVEPSAAISAVASWPGVERPVETPATHWRAIVLAAAALAVLVFWITGRVEPDGTQAGPTKLQRVTDHGQAQLVTMAPDATRMAYVRTGPRGESLHLINSEGSQEAELVAANGDRYQGVTFSPTGEWVYYVRGFQLHRIGLAGGKEEPLIDGVDRAIALSPDGARFAFVRDDVGRGENALYVAAADGTDPRPIAVRKKPMFYRAVAWSPRGDLVAASGGYEGQGRMDIVLVDTSGGSERPLGQGWAHVGEIGWYPDGSSLAASVRHEDAQLNQIVQIAYPSGDETALTGDLNEYRSVSVSRGGLVASVQGGRQSNLWMITPGGTEPPQALTSGSGADEHPAWLSDDAIVYQRRSGARRQIYRLELVTRTTRPLTPQHCDSTVPAVTPDGERIVFVSECTGPASLWRMRADGTELRQLTSGAGDNHPSISADGLWVYYESLDEGKPLVKRVLLAGGRPENVTSRLSRRPVVSSTGDVVACYYWDEDSDSSPGIALVSTRDGSLIRTVAVSNPARRWPFVRWSPDDRFLLTVGREADPQNVWGYPVAGGAPRAMTTFSDLFETYSFAWSPDQSRMIVSRGQRRDDVILIRPEAGKVQK